MQANLRHSRCGFTLVELLIVVAIIGVLIGILLPAVQRAEEAFKKTACQSNLRQWGVAMHNYHELYLTFPAGCTDHTSLQSGSMLISNTIAPHLQILPYFEENSFHENVDYSEWMGGTLPKHLLKIFQCPTDLLENRDDATSYQVNCGTWVDVNGWDGMFGPNTYETIFGPFGYMPGGLLPPVRIEDVLDGTSRTALMSEICSGRPLDSEIQDRELRGFTFQWTGTRPRRTSLGAARADILANSWQATKALNSQHGVDFRIGDPTSTWYNHVTPPNTASWMIGAFLNGDMHRQISPAQSFHERGVNLLLADGSVHYVRDNVNPDIWSALGTRAGNDGGTVP